MTCVLDASAMLAFLVGETGADQVDDAFAGPTACSAVNWSEVAQKVSSSGRDWSLGRTLLLSSGLSIEPVTLADAEWAARRWVKGSGLSIADRCCLALGERLDAIVLTADAAWGHDGRIRQIR